MEVYYPMALNLSLPKLLQAGSGRIFGWIFSKVNLDSSPFGKKLPMSI
jgi:hypothetical protein